MIPSVSLPVRRAAVFSRRAVLFSAIATLIASTASAKRAAPPKVEPLVHEGIRYVVPNDDGKRAYVQAWDIKSGKKLWEVTLFLNVIDPALEEDVQHFYITRVSIRGGTLYATCERSRVYELNLKTHAVTQEE
jgi:hypothetical protein